MASLAAQSTTAPTVIAPTVIAVLAELATASDRDAAMASCLASPSTPAPVRRFLAVILDQADRLANRIAVTL
jgi:hypothetical protein